MAGLEERTSRNLLRRLVADAPGAMVRGRRARDAAEPQFHRGCSAASAFSQIPQCSESPHADHELDWKTLA